MRKNIIIRICVCVVVLVALIAAALFLFGRTKKNTDSLFKYDYKISGRTLTVTLDRTGADGYLWTAACSSEGLFEVQYEPKDDHTDRFIYTANEGITDFATLTFSLQTGLDTAYQILLDISLDSGRFSVSSESAFQPARPETGGEEASGVAYSVFQNTDDTITVQVYVEKAPAEETEDDNAGDDSGEDAVDPADSDDQTAFIDKKKIEDDSAPSSIWSADAPERVSVLTSNEYDDGPVFIIQNESCGFGLPGENIVTISNAALKKQIRIVITEDDSGFGLVLVRHEVVDMEN